MYINERLFLSAVIFYYTSECIHICSNSTGRQMKNIIKDRKLKVNLHSALSVSTILVNTLRQFIC